MLNYIKRDFAGEITVTNQLMSRQGDCPRLSSGPHVITRALNKEGSQRDVVEEEIRDVKHENSTHDCWHLRGSVGGHTRKL